jgi:hypothetical protein
VHGDHDEIIPDWASRRTVEAMRKANPEAVAEMHALPGRPHDVVYGREDGLTFPFLERHVREPFPKQVSLRVRSLDYPRAFWLEDPALLLRSWRETGDPQLAHSAEIVLAVW